jgi:hypothetical protein
LRISNTFKFICPTKLSHVLIKFRFKFNFSKLRNYMGLNSVILLPLRFRSCKKFKVFGVLKTSRDIIWLFVKFKLVKYGILVSVYMSFI